MDFSLRKAAITVFFALNCTLASAQTNASSSAQSEDRGYLGGLLGISSVSQNVGRGLGFGLEGTVYFTEYLGVGAFVRRASHDNGITSFFYGAEGLFRLAHILPRLQVGFIVGAGKFTAGDVSGRSAIAYGTKAAFDVPLTQSQPLTVGLDLSLVFTKPGTEQLTVFTPVATVKYWF
jgi:hypothetical protein